MAPLNRNALDEQDALEGINQIMQDPGVVNTAQQRRDHEAYLAWKKKDSTSRAILVSSVIDDIIHECEQHHTAHDIGCTFGRNMEELLLLV